MLERGILERSQHSIHPGLVARPLSFEPLKNISIDAQRHRRFGWHCLQTPADNTPHDMLDLGFGVLVGKFDVLILHALNRRCDSGTAGSIGALSP